MVWGKWWGWPVPVPFNTNVDFCDAMVKEWCCTLKGRFRPLTCCNFCLNPSSKSDILWKPGLSTAHKTMLIAPTLHMSKIDCITDLLLVQEARKCSMNRCLWSVTTCNVSHLQRVSRWPAEGNKHRGWIQRLIIEICQQPMPTNHRIESIKFYFIFSYLLTFNQPLMSLSPASLPWCPVHHGSNPIGPWDSAHPNSSASPSFCRTRSRKITGNNSWYAAGCLSHRWSNWFWLWCYNEYVKLSWCPSSCV